MLQVTPKAAEALKHFLQAENKSGHALRIVAQSGCCSGNMYGLFLEKEATPEDIVIQQDGVNIYLDRMSEAMLSEAKLDFEMGPQGEAFFIDNPLDQRSQGQGGCGCSSGDSAKGSCGCGGGSCGCSGHESTV